MSNGELDSTTYESDKPINPNDDKSNKEVEDINQLTTKSASTNNLLSTSNNIISSSNADLNKKQTTQISVGNYFSIYLSGSLESGYFSSVNDVYVKYSILAGPDWLLLGGNDLGVTQIARYRIDENNKRCFVWNQPITISYKSYNFFRYPQLIVSVYNFDLFGNDQLVGYGSIHLPVSKEFAPSKQTVKIYSPQSSTYARQFLSWLTGRKPELVNFNLIGRGDCRSVLRMINVGELILSFNLTTKDVSSNGYRTS